MRILSAAVLVVSVCLVSPPSEAQTGKELSQAEVTKIKQVSETFVEAVRAKDWAKVASLYLEDGVINPPNEPAVKGRAAIQAWMEKFPPLTDFNLNSVKIEGRDDLAYVLGTYRMTFEPAGVPLGKFKLDEDKLAGESVTDSGKYVEIRRRQKNGRWLIAVDIFNSDLPSPPQK